MIIQFSLGLWQILLLSWFGLGITCGIILHGKPYEDKEKHNVGYSIFGISMVLFFLWMGGFFSPC